MVGTPIILHDFGDGCFLVGREVEIDTPFGVVHGWEHAVVCKTDQGLVVMPEDRKWALEPFQAQEGSQAQAQA